ncbi:MAG: hypothetical protein Q8909_15445, partial [Bacteroidota bacterium]|nr:hypothetical protein [Bacteroidota bacterium]
NENKINGLTFNLYNNANQNITPSYDESKKTDQIFNTEINNVFYGGDAPIFYIGKSRIEVHCPDTFNCKIKIEVSKSENSADEYVDIHKDDDYTNLYSSIDRKFSITKTTIQSVNPTIELYNNRYLRITAYNTTPTAPLLQAVYQTKIRSQLIWQMNINDIFFTPILFRVTGNAGGFNLGSVTPSIGARLYRYNTNSLFFNNINLSGFISMTNYGDNPSGYQYSIASGGFLDLSGIIQIGCGYSFHENKPYLLVGFSSTLFSKLFGNK